MNRSRLPVATLGDLHAQEPRWMWLRCTAIDCSHATPVALAPFVIRWGAEASSNILRERARCSRCGHQGAALFHPSWINGEIRFQPFPTGHRR